MNASYIARGVTAIAVAALFAGCSNMNRQEKGTAIGATSGAVAGAVVGGPVGAAVGGTAFLERLAGLAGPEAAGELSGVIEGHARTTAAEVLDRVRAKLKETTWQALYQAMVERRPAAEVAAALNLSIASVYKANFRVKQMLLEEYRHAFESGGDPHPVPGPGGAGEVPA